MTLLSWKPDPVEDPIEIAKFALLYTGRLRAFVVYETGTIVFSDTNLSRPDKDYDATLLAAVSETQNFNVQVMRQENFLVRFKGPVTGLVLGRFYDEHREAIKHGVDNGALLPGEEVHAGAGFSVPREHYYIGLYARSKLYVDAQSLKICERFTP